MKTLKKYSPEWVVEATRSPSILKAYLDNPENAELREAAIESLKKLGIVVPISPISLGSGD